MNRSKVSSQWPSDKTCDRGEWHSVVYRTVSANAIIALAVVQSIDLLLEERSRKFWGIDVSSANVQKVTLKRWQQRSSMDDGTGTSTKRLIPVLNK